MSVLIGLWTQLYIRRYTIKRVSVCIPACGNSTAAFTYGYMGTTFLNMHSLTIKQAIHVWAGEGRGGGGRGGGNNHHPLGSLVRYLVIYIPLSSCCCCCCFVHVQIP